LIARARSLSIVLLLAACVRGDERDARVERLLAGAQVRHFALAAESFATPQLTDGPEMDTLVKLGPRAVPSIVDVARRAPARTVAYACWALERIGDRGALEPARELAARATANDGDALTAQHACAATARALAR
jgi:hypothetical protein